MVNGEAVLDGGVPLNVGLKHIEIAIERLADVDKRTSKETRHLEKS
jgi:hypothetical protein